MKSQLISSFLIILTTHCVLKAPNITFTQSQTSLEKQMFGEEKELEKDGWMVTSVKSSNLTTSSWKKKYLSSSDPDIISILQSHALIQASLKKYKEKGYVGESLNGKVGINPNPPDTSNVMSQQEKKDLIKKVDSINEIRSKLYDHYKNDINISNFFYDTIENGEYFEKKPGIWDLKK
jgi:hypothetical protein